METRKKRELRIRRHERLRKRVHGTSSRPRLAVFKSARHFYAQLIDDEKAHTIATASTNSNTMRSSLGNTGSSEAAVKVGEMIAAKAKEKGIETVVFDHGGFGYRGKIKKFADKAREAGLKF
jgi:large subunit ribosomal protein L18